MGQHLVFCTNLSLLTHHSLKKSKFSINLVNLLSNLSNYVYKGIISLVLYSTMELGYIVPHWEIK